jgi:hypothetical protein
MDHLRTCPPLDDANSVHLYKLCLEQVNVCNEGIAILPDPENDFGTLEDPVLTIQTDDVDGIGKVTTAKLNGTDIPSCQAQDGAACYEISGTNIHIFVAPGLKDIPAGAYNVNIAWTDGKGIGGSNCKMQSSFEVLGEKIGDPVCGTLTGNYSSDTTDWPEGTFCSAGEPEPPNPEFPSLGGSTTWTCSNSDGIEVSCNATRDNITEAPIVPQTGVFDSVLGRVSVGVSFIFLGGLVSQYSKFNYLLNSISEKQQFRSEVKKQRKAKKRREKLEENFK